MVKALLSVLLCLLTLSGSAQYRNENSPVEDIRQLKKGALLIRLMTKQNSVNALRERGNSDAADSLKRSQDIYNKQIVAGFKRNFNFCPVYFFYSQYSDKIKEGEIDDVTFLNDSL